MLIKVPKQLALLEQQLRALREVVTPETRIIAAAKARDVHNSTLALFEKILGTTTTSLAWKKARLIHCVFTAPELADAPQTYSWKLDARRGPSITTPTFLPAAGWISARVSSCSIYRLI